MQKFMQGRALLRLALTLAVAFVLVASNLAALALGHALAADPTPQNSKDATNVVLAQYNGITRTSDFGANGVSPGFITAGWGVGDCYNNISYLNGTPTSAFTLTLQSSATGSQWNDTQTVVAITNSAVFSRVVLYGFFTRVAATGIQTNVNPITGSVVCTLRNQN